MKNTVFLDYTFLFDASEAFTHLYEFEKALSDFFVAYGMEAKVLKTIEGASGRRIIVLTKLAPIPLPQDPKPQGRPREPSSQFKQLSERKLRAPALKFQGKK